jgi:predicted nucleic acid-binding protein
MGYVIANSKKGGLLNNVREKLDGLINAGIWIGEDLYEEALGLSGELNR